jgi:hypothetical protein
MWEVLEATVRLPYRCAPHNARRQLARLVVAPAMNHHLHLEIHSKLGSQVVAFPNLSFYRMVVVVGIGGGVVGWRLVLLGRLAVQKHSKYRAFDISTDKTIVVLVAVDQDMLIGPDRNCIHIQWHWQFVGGSVDFGMRETNQDQNFVCAQLVFGECEHHRHY